MDIPFSDEFSYITAPTGASCCSHETCLFSAPTSPNRFKLSGFNNETNQPDEIPIYDVQELNQRLCGNPLPTLAFSDEQFYDGKVLPLLIPLKLPPRLLHNGNDNITGTRSLTASLPRSQGSMFKLRLSSRSLWNDDFDPFMAALEKVKEEKIGKLKGNHAIEPKSEALCYLPAQVICGPLKNTPTSSNILFEPKGLVFSEVVRMDNDEPKRTLSTLLAMDRKKDRLERVGFCSRKRNREQITKFLFGNEHMAKECAKQNLAVLKTSFLRKLGLEPRPTMLSSQR